MIFSCPQTAQQVTLSLTHSLITHSLITDTPFDFDIKERSQRLVTFETFDHSDEIVFIFASLHRICVILLYCIFVLFYIASLLSSLLLFISRFLTLSNAFYILLSATRTQEVDSTNYSQNKQPKCLSSVAGPERKQTNSNMIKVLKFFKVQTLKYNIYAGGSGA